MIRVFLSYARADGSEAAALVEEQLKSAGFKVWRDVRDLDPFNDFSVEIERAIIAAEMIVVLVTQSISESLDSFVRREILYAQGKHKCIVPIRLNNATVPILINHLTWIDGARLPNLPLRDELQRRLELHAQTSIAERDGTVMFVHNLIDDIIGYLESTTLVLLEIAAKGLTPVSGGTSGGLPTSMRILRKPQQNAQTFSPGALGQTAVEKRQRLVLHGAAGSGKTTTLLIAAREAANAFLEDTNRRLPIFCRAADWNAADDEPIIKWLERSAPSLPPSDLRAAIDVGRVALFVDGLDELGPRVARVVSGKVDMIDPRRDLLARLPPAASLLIATRSDILEDIGEPTGFGILDMEPLTDNQVADYLARAPKLADLVQREPSFRGLLQTPLMISLLGYVAQSDEIDVEARPQVGELTSRLQVVDEFVARRWQHEQSRGTQLATLNELLGFLGRVATYSGNVFGEDHVSEATSGNAAARSALLKTAIELEFVREEAQREFAFFHPCFAEYYATVHCRRYLGDQSSDGWDDRLFQRISQLGDRSFIPTLLAMLGDSFWRNEFGEQIAVALNGIANPGDASVVNAFLNLAANPGTSAVGIAAIGHFAQRTDDKLKMQFIDRISKRTMHVEEIHQLAGLGEAGVEALVRVYKELDEGDPWRGQIESYSIVRQRLRN